ncbi:speedy protein E4-like isoform X2 [Dromiciops gliroides]|uniref:speedy protein E4-like isoform X2 n=1 Tax=Dromiciops gliroides TaxID=33562 RepID=UPI001CC38543|nr:speedy protein E4-like isoform X2 [Dromiciops gliroides]
MAAGTNGRPPPLPEGRRPPPAAFASATLPSPTNSAPSEPRGKSFSSASPPRQDGGQGGRGAPARADSSNAAEENRKESDSKGRRGKKRRRYEWTVTEVGDTRIKMKRRRVASFCFKDLAVFSQLLEDPVVQEFLKTDVKSYANNETLLNMLVEYFDRLGFPQQSYSMVHFLLALYGACQLDTGDPSYRWYILPALLGTNWCQEGVKKFWPLQMEFLKAIDWEGWMSQELSEEVSDEDRTNSVLPKVE